MVAVMRSVGVRRQQGSCLGFLVMLTACLGTNYAIANAHNQLQPATNALIVKRGCIKRPLWSSWWLGVPLLQLMRHT